MKIYNTRKKNKTPEEYLEEILKESESFYCRSASVFQVYDNIEGGQVGSYKPLTKELLEGRVYIVNWYNFSGLEIHFKDCIWLKKIKGRDQLSDRYNQVIMFPTNK